MNTTSMTHSCVVELLIELAICLHIHDKNYSLNLRAIFETKGYYQWMKYSNYIFQYFLFSGAIGVAESKMDREV